MKVTIEKFNSLCEKYFDRMIKLVEKVLKDANVEKHEIEDIILVGGSTRIPKLQEMLVEFFEGKNLNCNVNPDEAVAYGATVSAALLNGSNAKTYFGINSVQDVIPMAIGIEAILENQKGRFATIVPKNKNYPTNMSKMFTTSRDNQTRTSIKIFQGNDKLAEHNFFLGEFTLDGIPMAPAAKESVCVTMRINALGILEVTAKSIGNGRCKSLNVSLNRKLSTSSN